MKLFNTSDSEILQACLKFFRFCLSKRAPKFENQPRETTARWIYNDIEFNVDAISTGLCYLRYVRT